MVLPLVQFIPELSLNLDPESGILGAGGGDLIILSISLLDSTLIIISVCGNIYVTP